MKIEFSKIDQTLNYIPLLSTLNALVQFVAQNVFKSFGITSKHAGVFKDFVETVEKKTNTYFFCHMIPLYGNYLAYKSLMVNFEDPIKAQKEKVIPQHVQEALENLKKSPYLLLKDIETSTSEASSLQAKPILVFSKPLIHQLLINHVLLSKEPAWMRDMKSQQILYYVMSKFPKTEVLHKVLKNEIELDLHEHPNQNFCTANIASVLPRILLLGLLILSFNFQSNQEEPKHLRDVCFPTLTPYYESPFLDYRPNFITNSVAPFETLHPPLSH